MPRFTRGTCPKTPRALGGFNRAVKMLPPGSRCLSRRPYSSNPRSSTRAHAAIRPRRKPRRHLTPLSDRTAAPRSLLPGAFLVPICLQALPALVLRHLETTLLFEISHGQNVGGLVFGERAGHKKKPGARARGPVTRFRSGAHAARPTPLQRGDATRPQMIWAAAS
jgi:hypothetical protein